ncbi:MAG: putative suppressor for copper-sensitivity [Proteobacteria bacterium]|nr:putative suppressor for copper-sensitivity [Pseudomonadota bacterium]
MTETPPAGKPAPRWRQWALEGLIFIVLFAAFQAWQMRDTPRGPAPQFAGQQTDGQPFDLAAWRREHPGQPLLIYFWADWCGVCKATAGSIDNVGQDWPMITVAMQSGPSDKVAETLRQRSHAWPTVADPEGSLFRQYGFQGVPAYVIVGPDGDIRSTTVGYTSEIGLRLRLWWAARQSS